MYCSYQLDFTTPAVKSGVIASLSPVLFNLSAFSGPPFSAHPYLYQTQKVAYTQIEPVDTKYRPIYHSKNSWDIPWYHHLKHRRSPAEGA